MKIAVFEPHPRLCGVTRWTFDVAQGFNDLGHDCQVVSFTNSGRTRRAGGERFNGWYWWHEEPHRTESWLKAGKVLDEYDLIVLNEPKNGTEDRAAKRLGIEPLYIGALRRTKTPWCTVLYAPQYDSQRTPYMANTLDAGNFTGLVVEQAPGAYESGAAVFDGRVKKRLFWPWFPYRCTSQLPDQPRTMTVAVGGRSCRVKGHAGLAAVAEQLPEGWVCRLAGSEAGGMGACFSYLTYQALTVHHGWVGQRYDERPGKKKLTPDAYGNAADKTNAHPWWVTKNGRTIQYTGSYAESTLPFRDAAIGVNLTARSFSTSIEYTHLEAMEAGTLPVMTKFVHDLVGAAGYDCLVLERFEDPAYVNAKRGLVWDDDYTAPELVAVLQQAIDRIYRGDFDPTHNRHILETVHAPRHLAQHILEAVA